MSLSEPQTLKTWVYYRHLFYSCILYIEKAIAKKNKFGNGCPHLHHLHMQKYTE